MRVRGWVWVLGKGQLGPAPGLLLHPGPDPTLFPGPHSLVSPGGFRAEQLQARVLPSGLCTNPDTLPCRLLGTH